MLENKFHMSLATFTLLSGKKKGLPFANETVKGTPTPQN